MNTFIKIIILLSFSLSCIACSLDYGNNEIDESSSPDFIFYNNTFYRVENNILRVKVEADTLEQYVDKEMLYGKNVSFSVFNSDKEKEINGFCNYLRANTEIEEYQFYENVQLQSYEQNIEIFCTSLRWNNKAEIISTEKNQPVTLIFGGLDSASTDSSKTTVEAQGFRLSISDVSYSLSGPIKGSLEDNQ